MDVSMSLLDTLRFLLVVRGAQADDVGEGGFLSSSTAEGMS